MERRSAQVYAQWWLRGMQPVRGALPALIGAVGRREMRRAEPRLAATRGQGGLLVGEGGAADERARTARTQRDR